MLRKLLNATLPVFLFLLVTTASAGAAVPHYEATSASGNIVFFTTAEQLVPGDTDNRVDVYESSFEAGLGEYVTRELSTGPTGGNDAVDALFLAASESGNRVFFQTSEPLVAADTDRSVDVYARNLGGGSPTLVTVGESGQNGPAAANFAGSTPNGEEVFFTTSESFSAADQDGAADIYERDLATGETHLVSSLAPGCSGCEEGAFPFLSGVAAGGQRVFFASAGKLSSADQDTAIDIYAHDLPNGPTELVSAGDPGCAPCGNDSSRDVVFAGSSSDGSRVFFETSESLTSADTDTATDVYERAAGTTTLISPGTENVPANVPREESTLKPAISTDGSKVFFATTEPLPGDSDNANDIYEYEEGSGVRLVTPNSCTSADCGVTYNGLTPDGSILAFSTDDPVDPADEDASQDVYLVPTAGGAPVLASGCGASCGNGAYPALFDRMSQDASTVLFNSAEKLSPVDVDSSSDIFARDLSGEEAEIVSAPGLCPLAGGCDAGYVGASDDLTHVFFSTAERLDSDDTDSEADLYERDRETGVTRLVSRKNEATIGPSVPIITGTSPGSPGASTTPAILGKSDPGTTIKLYLGAGCQGLPLQTLTPATAAQLEGSGIAVSVAPGSTTTFSASASDSEGVDSGCSGTVTYVQQEATPPVGGGEEPAGGSTGGSTTGSGGGSTGSGEGGGKKGQPGFAYVTPAARITFGPAAKTRVRRPVFRFFDATGQPGSTFICRVDHRRWKRCSSPIKLPRLSFGRHVFAVKASNALGVPAPSPVRRKFKVVR